MLDKSGRKPGTVAAKSMTKVAPKPSSNSTRPRPPILRALGKQDPPAEIQIDGTTHRLIELLKHDSWAATALYASRRGIVVCKFNRIQPILFVPMGWLGRYLANKEARLLKKFANLKTIPPFRGPICLNGKEVRNAVAHDFVPGHPLQEKEWVNDDFFPILAQTLTSIHESGVAYVDLHKRENIIVGDDNRPYLVDFQVCFELANSWPRRNFFTRWILKLLQQSDNYHLQKHIARIRPDVCGSTIEVVRLQPPWWIRIHRMIGVPLRTMRRKLLVLLGIRKGRGRVHSEQFIEDGLRPVGDSSRDRQVA